MTQAPMEYQQDPQYADENYPQEYGQQMYYEDDNEEVSGALKATRMNKKKAADDARLLANRIALLKMEEKKAWKKIQETKRKAE